MRLRSVFQKWFLACAAFVSFSSCFGAAAQPEMVQTAIRQKIEAIIKTVDSEPYQGAVSSAEFIVKAFQLTKQRLPDQLEFRFYQGLLAQQSLKRSDLCALLLADSEAKVTWDKCREFIRGNPLVELQQTATARVAAERLTQASEAELAALVRQRCQSPQQAAAAVNPQLTAAKAVPVEPYEEYQVYFGYLHAHSELSDGQGTALEAYQFARDQGKLDFFALTDHGELLISWPWSKNKKWDQLKAAAAATYAPGTFATLWGFEWSNPLLGHINIINTDDFTNCIANFGVGDIYRWLAKRPQGFGQFNHPGDYDLIQSEFDHFEIINPQVVPQLVGIETWNGSQPFDKYFYGGSYSGNRYSYLDAANQAGWRLGALGSQDNHQKDWGTKNRFRTAVLAKSLTREAIVEAYQQRRFYATEDADLWLDFRCSGYSMGSQLTGVPRHFTVSAYDKSGDTFAEVRLYRNGDLLATQTVAGNSIRAVFTDDDWKEPAYYYVIVSQNDANDQTGRNDAAITSAIWVE